MTNIEKHRIEYSEYGKLLNELVIKIKESKIKFDYIYGHPRGGLPIAVHLSHHLEIPMVDDLDNSGNILIVDDLCDSGETFKGLYNYQDHYNTLYFACLYVKPRRKQKFEPNFYIREVEDFIWIEFPFEKQDEQIDKIYMFNDGIQKEDLDVLENFICDGGM